MDMAERGLSSPDSRDLALPPLGSLILALFTLDLSSASGHHITLPKMPQVMMPVLAPMALTMPLRCPYRDQSI